MRNMAPAHAIAGIDESDVLERPSGSLRALFHFYLRWYVGRHFHALRLAHSGRFPSTSGPLIVCLNHASWWDPLTCMLLSRHWLPRADHYAPMEAASLRQYRFMRKLGLFPVESGTRRGAAQFLKAGSEILSASGSVLWITPEGRFTDVRSRPIVLRPGLAALVSRPGPCTVLPLAIEYTFWDERLPEILTLCGAPIAVTDGRSRSAQQWSDCLASEMTAAQERLAGLAALRDPAQFDTVISGRAGVGAMYDAWRRLSARSRGERFHAEHGSIRRL